MMSLRFPSGYPVEIDETKIWRQLSDWLMSTGYNVALSRDDGGEFVAVLGLWRGHSRLHIADAVAQALQIAVSEGS